MAGHDPEASRLMLTLAASAKQGEIGLLTTVACRGVCHTIGEARKGLLHTPHSWDSQVSQVMVARDLRKRLGWFDRIYDPFKSVLFVCVLMPFFIKGEAGHLHRIIEAITAVANQTNT